jgi:hypothetical protein
METKTKQDDVGQLLQEAVLRAAMPAEESSAVSIEKRSENEKKQAVSPRSGAPTPAGRPAGVKNKLTNLRDAVLEAFDQVGGAQYLAKLAQGSSSDRAAFVSLVSKVLPTQINADVSGGIQVQLSWLGSRNIGATASQTIEQVSQVVDLQRDAGGKYRIIDPIDTPAGQAADGQAGSEGAGGAPHA